MPKRDWRDHWVFGLFDLLYVLAGVLELLAYWHWGWSGVLGATAAIVIALVAARLARKRIKQGAKFK